MSSDGENQVQFECALSSPKSIRNFAAAFACLAKLGKEVTLEATQSTRTLILRQVNPAKTAFLSFEFRGDFFEHFGVASNATTCAKLKLKSCQAVFRTIKPMERLSLSLVALGNTKHVVMFRSDCAHEVTKTHQFYFEECEAMDPVFDREITKHRIKADPKFLLEVVSTLHAAANEVEFVCTAGIQVKITSKTNPTENAVGEVNTEMIIPQEKFLDFEISEQTTTLVFSIREWRELLKFCDAASQREVDQVFLLFNDTGMPLMLASELSASSDIPSPFAFTLVLSTIPAVDL